MRSALRQQQQQQQQQAIKQAIEKEDDGDDMMMMITRANTLLYLPTPPPASPSSLPFLSLPLSTHCPPSAACPTRKHKQRSPTLRGRRSLPAPAASVDDDVGGFDLDEDVDEDELVELDNKTDFDLEYDRLLGSPASASPDDIDMLPDEGFTSTEGWEAGAVVNYRINEEEFHKIRLLDCEFFVRKAPDPDDNVYDFREMYVTPPDTDVYSIPKILAPMPQKYIRCSKTTYGRYNVTEPIIDAPRDPLYKSEREVLKVFLTKHYGNRRLSDAEFVLDFEEIYVIDSKTKSITRAKVVVTVPEGKNRDRRNDLLIIRDGGNSFKIIDKSQRKDPTTVIEREEWAKSRNEIEKFLRRFPDLPVSNWF